MLKPVIFISAVSRELKTSRQVVANTLTAIGFEPDWQDIFDLSADEIPTMLRKKVDRASGVLQIVGDAYGGECPEVPPDAGVERCSYTQYEALYAKSVGKPVYYLIASPDLPRDLSPEQLGEDETKRSLQAAYKQAVLSSRTVYYQVGSHDSTENKVRKLKDELDKLRRGFRRLLTIAAAGLAILLCLAVGGIVLQQLSAADLAEQRRLIEEESRKRAAAESAAKAVDATVLIALRKLQEEVAAATEPGKQVEQATRIAGAYVALEQELGLKPGTLERELPRIAAQLLADADVSPFDQQAALYAKGRYAEAEALALDVGKRELAAAVQRTEAAIAAFLAAGDAASAEKRYAAAVSHYEQASSLVDRRKNPGRWSQVNRALAIALMFDGQSDEGGELYVQSLLAQSEILLVDMEKRLPGLNETWATRKANLGPRHPETIEAGNNLATMYATVKRFDEAVPVFKAVLDARKETLGADDPETDSARERLIDAYSQVGDFEAVVSLREEMLESRRKQVGEDAPETLASRKELADAYADANRREDAIRVLEVNLPFLKEQLGDGHEQVLANRDELARLYLRTGLLDDALRHYQESLTRRKQSLGDDHADTLKSMHNVATALRDLNRLDEAIDLFERTLELAVPKLGETAPLVIRDRHNFGVCLQRAGKPERASEQLKLAWDWTKDNLPPQGPLWIEHAQSYIDALRAAGREEEAAAVREEMQEGAEEPAETSP